MPTELNHPREELINIKNIADNEWFKWCLVRHLSSEDCNPKRNTKADKDFSKKIDFKDTKFLVKVRDIHKIEKKNSTALVFLVMKIRKNIQSNKKML